MCPHVYIPAFFMCTMEANFKVGVFNMKNLRKLFGIIFVAAIIVCTFLACELFPNQPQTQTPVEGDYDIGNLAQYVGSVTAVTITPKSGKSSGARTIYYAGTGNTTYARSTTLPTAAGTYVVTFDVAAATGWNAATGLSAGTLTIVTPTPVASDYEISGLAQTYGIVKAVTITPKAGKSSGARTIHYEGTGSTTYEKSTTLPSEKGIYAVTFDVAAVSGWNAATGLSAGNLDINDKQTPVADDYEISGLAQTAGTVVAVTITPKTDKSSGARTIYYAGTGSTTYARSTTLPTAAGTYAVTFDVAAATNWNPATGLSAGNLVVASQKPVATDYDFGNLEKDEGSSTAVTITPKAGKSSGARTIYYEGTSGTTYGKSVTVPTKAGTYAVTFDVAAVTGWDAATGLIAPNLKVNSKEAISVTITPPANGLGVGKRLSADVLKNFTGPVTYQWLREGQNIPGETAQYYYTRIKDADKKISVIAKCGDKTSEPSQPVTIPHPSQYSFHIGISDIGELFVYILFNNGDAWSSDDFDGDDGFSFQWLRNGNNPINGARSWRYTPQPADAGKTITVRVTTGWGDTVDSNEIEIPATLAGTTWDAICEEDGEYYIYTLSFNASDYEMVKTKEETGDECEESKGTYMVENLFYVSFTSGGKLVMRGYFYRQDMLGLWKIDNYEYQFYLYKQ
jgi:hypothetical protein